MANRTRSGERICSLAALAALLALAACSDGGAATRGGAGQARSAATVEADAPVCRPSGAHGAHAAFPRGCETCHQCGGDYGFPADLVMPRGTTTAGGEIVRDPAGGGTTCSVGCHNPSGSTPATVAWNATGPLACTSCHFQVAAAQPRSAHAVASPDREVERAGCQACHVLSTHLSGSVRIAVGDGTSVEVRPGDGAQLNAACTGCHDGAGSALAGRTPPLLVGYAAGGGDFHGARAGTGYGGTLAAPYARGQAALPCATCHDAHASGNAFLFAASVNGAAVPAGAIDRAGVGAQALCEACHQGPRHAPCAGCHGVDPMPAGAPCFACHGHEGIVTFVAPSPHHDIKKPNPGCNHCHGAWMPANERIPPVIASGGLVVVRDVTATSVRLEWDTNEPATSWVEYGVGAPGQVAGSDALTVRHAVTLTGLSEGTTYAFRVRSSDAMRNVTRSAPSTFATASAHAPGAPVLVDQNHFWVCEPSATVTLAWGAVTDPDGDPVEYRVMVDDAAGLESPIVDSGWIAERNFAAVLPATAPPTYYYWRVMARDAAHDARSPWSAIDTFAGVLGDVNDCY
jgi:hypothetical protein